MAMVSLVVEIDTAELEAGDRDELATDLGRRLRELDGAALSTIASAATSNGGSAEGGLIGAFALSISPDRRTLGTALETIRSWTAEVPSRSVVVELDGDRLTVDGEERTVRVLRAFLDRHAQDA